jgi:predicted kinase
MMKIVPTAPLLIMLYGYPGSGKSYVARQLSNHIQAAHIQGDRIRYELFEKPYYDKQENAIITQLMDYMTQEFLSAGISVIYDTNALRATQRHSLREVSRKAHAKPLVIWLQIDTDSALARTKKRDRRKADDRYTPTLDEATFNTISSHMQNPTMAEDYVVISGKHVFNTQLSAIMKKLNDMNIIHLDEMNTGVAKPGLVNRVPNLQSGRVDLGRRRNIMIR